MKRQIAAVYVIEDGGRVKVGSSWEPEKRWCQLGRVGRLVYATPQHPQGRRIEAVAHQLLVLAGLRVKDEWFLTDQDRAVKAIKRATKIVEGRAVAPAGVRVAVTNQRCIVSVQISRDVAERADAWVREQRPNMSMSLAVELGLDLLMKRKRSKG